MNGVLSEDPGGEVDQELDLVVLVDVDGSLVARPDLEGSPLDVVLELGSLEEVLGVLTDLVELHVLEDALEDDVEGLNSLSLGDGRVVGV